MKMLSQISETIKKIPYKEAILAGGLMGVCSDSVGGKIQEIQLSDFNVQLSIMKKQESDYIQKIYHRSMLKQQSDLLYEALYKLLWVKTPALTISQSKQKVEALKQD
jgi:hypothetical protein